MSCLICGNTDFVILNSGTRAEPCPHVKRDKLVDILNEIAYKDLIQFGGDLKAYKEWVHETALAAIKKWG